MTDDDHERTKLSGFRFAGAFLGGLLVMGFLPMLVAFFGGDGENDALGYQYTMYVFAALLVALMLITVFTTKERITPHQQAKTSLGKELGDLSNTYCRYLNTPVCHYRILLLPGLMTGQRLSL